MDEYNSTRPSVKAVHIKDGKMEHFEIGGGYKPRRQLDAICERVEMLLSLSERDQSVIGEIGDRLLGMEGESSGGSMDAEIRRGELGRLHGLLDALERSIRDVGSKIGRLNEV